MQENNIRCHTHSLKKKSKNPMWVLRGECHRLPHAVLEQVLTARRKSGTCGASEHICFAVGSAKCAQGSDEHLANKCDDSDDQNEKGTLARRLTRVLLMSTTAHVFPRPEKNDTARFNSDFQKLNECVTQHPFLLTQHMQESFMKHFEGVTHVS